jgi:hypothetical protein
VQRYARNPNEIRDRSICGTAIATYPVDLTIFRTTGWPDVQDLVPRIDRVAQLIVQRAGVFRDTVRDLLAEDLQFEDVRIPLDRRRYGVTPSAWYPTDVLASNIGSTRGMVEAFLTVIKDALQHALIVPILLDVNPYYRIIKAVYGASNVGLNIAGALHRHPLLFGVWHPYAHTLKRTRAAFLADWSNLEYVTLLHVQPQVHYTDKHAHQEMYYVTTMSSLRFTLKRVFS